MSTRHSAQDPRWEMMSEIEIFRQTMAENTGEELQGFKFYGLTIFALVAYSIAYLALFFPSARNDTFMNP